MSHSTDRLAIYLSLARVAERRLRAGARDHLLAIAAIEAHDLGLHEAAERCRQKILAHNPGHVLRHSPTLAEAIEDERFAAYYRKALRRYPQERAEHMLGALGVDLANERATYASDLEYALALVGADEANPTPTSEASTSNNPKSKVQNPKSQEPNPYAAPRSPDGPNATRRIADRPPTAWGHLIFIAPMLFVLAIILVLSLLDIVRELLRSMTGGAAP